MSKKDKINPFLIVGVISVLGVAGYFAYKMLKPKVNNAGVSAEDMNNPSGLESDSNIHKKGDKGVAVKTIQSLLNSIITMAKRSNKVSGSGEQRRIKIASLKPLTEDGIWGSKTDSNANQIVGRNKLSINELRSFQENWTKTYNVG